MVSIAEHIIAVLMCGGTHIKLNWIVSTVGYRVAEKL